jgi:hypothetical protein
MTRPVVYLALLFGVLGCEDFESPSGPVDASTRTDASSDAEPPVPDAGDAGDAGRGDGGATARRRVFVTTLTTSGSMTFGGGGLGGVAGADAECQREADQASLKGEFLAFLPTGPGQSARDRFDLPKRNLVLPDGTQVALGIFDLFATGPNVSLDEGADATKVTGNATVYTGTTRLGANAAENCNFWSQTVANGSYGLLTDTAGWVEAPNSMGLECSSPRRIYCFER